MNILLKLNNFTSNKIISLLAHNIQRRYNDYYQFINIYNILIYFHGCKKIKFKFLN